MYQWIAKRQLLKGYAAISRADFASVASTFHPHVRFQMVGDHALGGQLVGRDQVLQWAGRLARLFPTLKIEAESIHVAGWPWDMVIMARFRVSETLPDGTPYENRGLQWLHIRLGQVVEDVLMEDMVRLKDALQRVAASGNQEAIAPPLRQP
ncbi:MAG: nuclear transport factor 2 family protein [Anaerolineae bacterium]|nr:nuclear transport factor 2 family protein [Anaerolineae bacterium]